MPRLFGKKKSRSQVNSLADGVESDGEDERVPPHEQIQQGFGHGPPNFEAMYFGVLGERDRILADFQVIHAELANVEYTAIVLAAELRKMQESPPPPRESQAEQAKLAVQQDNDAQELAEAREQIDELRMDVQRLSTENDNLTDKNQDLHETNERLAAEVSRLEAQLSQHENAGKKLADNAREILGQVSSPQGDELHHQVSAELVPEPGSQSDSDSAPRAKGNDNDIDNVPQWALELQSALSATREAVVAQAGAQAELVLEGMDRRLSDLHADLVAALRTHHHNATAQMSEAVSGQGQVLRELLEGLSRQLDVVALASARRTGNEEEGEEGGEGGEAALRGRSAVAGFAEEAQVQAMQAQLAEVVALCRALESAQSSAHSAGTHGTGAALARLLGEDEGSGLASQLHGLGEEVRQTHKMLETLASRVHHNHELLKQQAARAGEGEHGAKNGNGVAEQSAWAQYAHSLESTLLAQQQHVLHIAHNLLHRCAVTNQALGKRLPKMFPIPEVERVLEEQRAGLERLSSGAGGELAKKGGRLQPSFLDHQQELWHAFEMLMAAMVTTLQACASQATELAVRAKQSERELGARNTTEQQFRRILEALDGRR